MNAEPDAPRHLQPFQKLQVAFAAHIRHPSRNPPPPGVEARRMDVYVRLFYNNIEAFLAGTFDVLRAISSTERWHALVRDFMHRHHAETPYFSRIPEEFLEYLGAPDRDGPAVPPFALELCHFQWVQLALDRAADTGVVFDDEPMDLDAKLSLSPLAWPLRYAYPVRRIGPDHQPDEPPAEATYLIACRDRRDRVRIIESNAVTTRLLQLVAEGEDGRGCCAAIAAELGAPLARIEASALAMLNRLHRLDVVIRTP